MIDKDRFLIYPVKNLWTYSSCFSRHFSTAERCHLAQQQHWHYTNVTSGTHCHCGAIASSGHTEDLGIAASLLVHTDVTPRPLCWFEAYKFRPHSMIISRCGVVGVLELIYHNLVNLIIRNGFLYNIWDLQKGINAASFIFKALNIFSFNCSRRGIIAPSPSLNNGNSGDNNVATRPHKHNKDTPLSLTCELQICTVLLVNQKADNLGEPYLYWAAAPCVNPK